MSRFNVAENTHALARIPLPYHIALNLLINGTLMSLICISQFLYPLTPSKQANLGLQD